LHEVPRRVVDEARMGAAAAAAALIEQHDAIGIRVEEAPRAGVAAGARPAVNEQGRLSFRIAALLEVDLVLVRDTQHAAVVRLDFGVERASTGSGRGGALASGEDRVTGMVAAFSCRGFTHR